MKSRFTRVKGSAKTGSAAKDAAGGTARVAGSRPPLAFALEPRFMFDAAGAATADPAAADHSADPAAASHDTSHATDHSADQQQAQAVAAPATATAPVTAPVEVRAADPAQNDGKKEVVFIETNVAGYQTLVDGVKAGAEVVLLNANQDGLSQMAQWAQTHSGYDAIHIISHGAEEQINLGSLTLDITTATTRAGDLATLGSALTENGDLLLYGCDVAANQRQGFLTAVAEATRADVAASDDLTGATSLGGNWTLEVSAGKIDENPLQIERFSGLLNLANTKVYTDDLFSSANDANSATPVGVNGTDLADAYAGLDFDVTNITPTSATFTITTNANGFNTQGGDATFNFTFVNGANGVLDSITGATLDTAASSSIFTTTTANYAGLTANDSRISVSGKTFSIFLPQNLAPNGVGNHADRPSTNLSAGLSLVFNVTTTSLASGTAPTVTGITGATTTYTEDGSAVSLFSGAVADSKDSGQNFTGATFTVTHVSDSTEYLRINGVDVALTNATSQALGTNYGTANVSVDSGTHTATVTVSGMSIDNSAMGTLLNGVKKKKDRTKK